MIPLPRKVETGTAKLKLHKTLRIGSVLGDAIDAANCAAVAAHQILADRFLIVVQPDCSDPEISLEVESACGDEEYRLQVDETGIRILSRTGAGWFYGLNTLWQLLRGCSETILHQSIVDRPRFSWRGLHLDVCRHFFDVSFIKRLLDVMAIYKLNRFHWHLTDDQGWRLDVPAYPRLKEISAWRDENGTKYGGIYSHAEIRDVVAYAAQRCITVVPEIELPGHSVAALAAYPELACAAGPFEVETDWGIFEDVYCAGNDQALEFLKDVFRVVIELFPGKYVHIGGDECPKTRWLDCPKCLKRIQVEHLHDEDQLQSWFVGKMVEFLHEQGKQAIGWDEILEGGLAPGVVVMSWRGVDQGVDAARQGHDVIMSPTTHCYFDYRQLDSESEPGYHGSVTLRDVYDFNPVPVELTAEQAEHVIGAQGNVWTERMYAPKDVEFMVLPRLCALAEVVWSPQESRRWNDFQSRLGPHLEMLRDLGYRPRSS
jgi:hexosaminidase